ncbi:MAG TPA: hypothetical protein VFE51_14815 [Verrucomicrobiae bacterium]|nr:hypothetical protein [Verrucomicrobiae bacterium]
MEKTKERQASSLTLATNQQKAERLISQALGPRASANPSAKLEPGLASPLADKLADPPAAAKLGRPMYLTETAAMLGCSPWTVRQKLMPRGLPFFRSAASGKLIFYEAQVERWIEKIQGGIYGEPLQTGQRLVDVLLHRRRASPGKYRRY